MWTGTFRRIGGCATKDRRGPGYSRRSPHTGAVTARSRPSSCPPRWSAPAGSPARAAAGSSASRARPARGSRRSPRTSPAGSASAPRSCRWTASTWPAPSSAPRPRRSQGRAGHVRRRRLVALLRRLRAADEPVVYAPEFRRAIEEPIAGAIPCPRRPARRLRGQLPAARGRAVARRPPAAGQVLVRGDRRGDPHRAARPAPRRVRQGAGLRRRLGRAQRRAQRAAHRADARRGRTWSSGCRSERRPGRRARRPGRGAHQCRRRGISSSARYLRLVHAVLAEPAGLRGLTGSGVPAASRAAGSRSRRRARRRARRGRCGRSDRAARRRSSRSRCSPLPTSRSQYGRFGRLTFPGVARGGPCGVTFAGYSAA